VSDVEIIHNQKLVLGVFLTTRRNGREMSFRYMA